MSTLNIVFIYSNLYYCMLVYSFLVPGITALIWYDSSENGMQYCACITKIFTSILLRILFSELGFDQGFMNVLRTRYLLPITTVLFPECVGVGLDSHQAFVVTYSASSRLGDVGLTHHYDNAKVMLNVCLGKEFSDGELFFEDMKDVSREIVQYFLKF